MNLDVDDYQYETDRQRNATADTSMTVDPPPPTPFVLPPSSKLTWKSYLIYAAWAMVLLFANDYLDSIHAARQMAALRSSAEVLEEGAVRLALFTHRHISSFQKGAAEANEAMGMMAEALESSLIRVASSAEDEATVREMIEKGEEKDALSAPASGVKKNAALVLSRLQCLQSTSYSMMCPLSIPTVMGWVNASHEANKNTNNAADKDLSIHEALSQWQGIRQAQHERRQRYDMYHQRGGGDGGADDGGKEGGVEGSKETSSARRQLLQLPAANKKEEVGGSEIKSEPQQQQNYLHYNNLPNEKVAPIDSFEVFLMKLLNMLPSSPPSPPSPSEGSSSSSPSLIFYRPTVVAMLHESLASLHSRDDRRRWDEGSMQPTTKIGNANTKKNDEKGEGEQIWGGGGVSSQFPPHHLLPRHYVSIDYDYMYGNRYFLRGCGGGSGGDATEKVKTLPLPAAEPACLMGESFRNAHSELMKARANYQRSNGYQRRGGGGHNGVDSTNAIGSSADGENEDVTAIANPMLKSVILVYYDMYRYLQTQRRVLELREKVLGPLVKAMNDAGDATMLHNFI